jgi:hypothetical protein
MASSSWQRYEDKVLGPRGQALIAEAAHGFRKTRSVQRIAAFFAVMELHASGSANFPGGGGSDIVSLS